MELKDITRDADEPTPYMLGGLSLYLSDDILEALGMTMDDFKIGEDVVVLGIARVESREERQYGEDEPRQCVCLCMTQMGVSTDQSEVEEEESEGKRTVGAKLYGG